MEVIWEAQYQESQNPVSIFAPSILNPLVSPEVLTGVLRESVINNHPNITIRDFGHVVNKPNMLIDHCTEIDRWIKQHWTEPATPRLWDELRNHWDGVYNFDYVEKNTLELLHPDYISFLGDTRARALRSLQELQELQERKTRGASLFHKPFVSTPMGEATTEDGRPPSRALTAAPKYSIT